MAATGQDLMAADTRAGLALAMSHRIEAFYRPTRRHSAFGYLNAVDYESRTAA
jgi:hypothetical protein